MLQPQTLAAERASLLRIKLLICWTCRLSTCENVKKDFEQVQMCIHPTCMILVNLQGETPMFNISFMYKVATDEEAVTRMRTCLT